MKLSQRPARPAGASQGWLPALAAISAHPAHPPADRAALNCPPGRPHRLARDRPVQHSRPYYRATPAGPPRGYACPSQPQPRQLLDPGGPRRHQLPSSSSAVSGGWSSHGPHTCSQPAAGPRARQQACPASTPAAAWAGRRLTARRRQLTHLPRPLRHCTRNANCESKVVTHGQFTAGVKDVRMRKGYQILVVALF